jgi:uncharacterized membrane protein
MNASQIHLALTHVPVILSVIGLVILIIALVRKNDTLTKTSFYIFLTAGIFALPVYFTGEGAEEVVEEFPGISESVIGRHEQFANISLTIILICGVISLAALFLYKHLRAAKIIKYAVLIFAFGSALSMAQTAHLGGQIRHTEIGSTFTSAVNDNENQNGEDAKQESGTEKKKDKDDDD